MRFADLHLNETLLAAVAAEGYVTPKGTQMSMSWTSQVLGDYLSAAGIPLLRGRDFTDADRAGSPLVVIVSLLAILIATRKRSGLLAFLGSCAYLAAMLGGAAAGLFPVLLPTVGTNGRDLTIALAAAGTHTLHIGLVWWSLGMALATMYFSIVYWLFRGKVPAQLDGYGH